MELGVCKSQSRRSCEVCIAVELGLKLALELEAHRSGKLLQVIEESDIPTNGMRFEVVYPDFGFGYDRRNGKHLLKLGPGVRDPDSRSSRELGRHLVCHGGIIDGDPEACVGSIEAALPVVRPVHDDAERRIDSQPDADPLVPLLEPVGDVEMRDDRELVLKL